MEESTVILQNIMRSLDEILPNIGKALIVFDIEEPGRTNYISNCNRQDMVIALRETADRIEMNAIEEPNQQN